MKKAINNANLISDIEMLKMKLGEMGINDEVINAILRDMEKIAKS